MDLAKEIKNLTKQDRQAIRVLLQDVYSSEYVFKMFAGTRKRTEVFEKAVITYIEGINKTANEVKTLIENR